MAADKKEPNYIVGYGKPPEHTQFKKGQSGNPQGRPSAKKNLRAAFCDMMSEPISFCEGDQIRRMSKSEAVLYTLTLRAIKGDSRATAQTLGLLREQRLLVPTERSEARPTGVLIVPGMAPDQGAWEKQARDYMVKIGAVSDDHREESQAAAGS